MARPRKYRDPDSEDVRLICALKEERDKLKHERRMLPPWGQRNDTQKARVIQIERDLRQLTDVQIAVDFELSYWSVKGISR